MAKNSILYRMADMRRLLRDHPFGSRLVILLCALAAAGFAYQTLKPSVYPVAVVKDGDIRHIDSWADTKLPLPHTDEDILVHVYSVLPFGKLQLYVDDCVQKVHVNGKGLAKDRFPYCNWFDYMTLDVSGFTHVGSNTLTVVLHNDRGMGRLRVTAANASWLYRFTLAFFLAAIAAFGAWWFRHERSAAARVTVIFVILGILLRVFYAAYTESDTRAYDWDGHQEYIAYIADHWILPVGNQGWEFHQQPLYYLFGGAVLSAMRFLHAEDSFTFVLQFFSLLMSVGTLCAGAWIASMLFPAKAKHAAFERFAFMGLFATLPGLIMFTTRVNNDVPTLLLVTLSVAYLLSWWKHGTLETWAAAASFAVLALLTKSSALPLLAPIGLLFLLRKETLREKCVNGLLLLTLLTIALGGTFIVRVLVQGQHELVPVWVTSGLRVKNFLGAYTTFNPWQILMHPFNHNWIDGERRQYMWEYFFKSAFFGEWEFRSYFDYGSTIVLSSGLLLIPVWIWGVVRSARKPSATTIALYAFMVVSLLALVAFRYMHPNSSNQELRYIAFVVIPIGYFLARGIVTVKYRLPFAVVAGVMFVASSVFTVLAAWHSA